jgi:glycogen synthase
MELLLVTRALYPIHGYGGMERHCYDWIRALSKLGCRIHVVTMQPKEGSLLSDFPKETSFYFIPGVESRSVLKRITSYPAWVQRVAKFLKQFTREAKLDAIYAQGLSAAACTSLAVPLYYNPHGMEEFKVSGLKHLAYTSFRNLSRSAARSSRRIVATDRSLVSEIRDFFEVTDNQIALIPNAVDISETQPSAAQRIPNASRILSVGRLERNKGFHVLLEALQKAKSLPSDWNAIIVGDGSERAALEAMAKTVGIDQRVTFAGAVANEELEELYESSDLFVHPTLYEGSSIVTLEAMKHELPIVASKTGGLPDKVFPGKNGWLVPPGDSNALANILDQAFDEKDSWAELGKHSKQIVLERYSWDRIGPEFLKLFQNLQAS